MRKKLSLDDRWLSSGERGGGALPVPVRSPAFRAVESAYTNDKIDTPTCLSFSLFLCLFLSFSLRTTLLVLRFATLFKGRRERTRGWIHERVRAWFSERVVDVVVAAAFVDVVFVPVARSNEAFPPGGFRASHCFEKTDRFYDPFQPLFRRDSRKLAARCLSLFAALRGSLRLLEARVRFSSRFTNIFSRLLEQRSRQLNINRKSRIFLVFWLFSIVMKLDL